MKWMLFKFWTIKKFSKKFIACFQDTDNNCCPQIFSEFIQTQEKYWKINYLLIILWQIKYSNLKTICQIKLKKYLCIKLHWLQNISYLSLRILLIRIDLWLYTRHLRFLSKECLDLMALKMVKFLESGHSHKKRDNNLETRVVYIEISFVSWNLLNREGVQLLTGHDLWMKYRLIYFKLNRSGPRNESYSIKDTY